ncbi:MAG: GyrI-like domain-containing protein, partial [Treponema sp.]|nr:GyrI-like domain-containing protein [Treponema sp.]
MPFDYKKEFKDLYLPSKKPQLVTVPKMNFLAVRGKGGYKIADFFDYVVPPLEGFWWQEKENSALAGFDYSDKSSLKWISVIRLPDFVTLKNFEWAKEKADNKKGLDCSKAEMLSFEEGLCVQIMHIGSYDDEPASVKEM